MKSSPNQNAVSAKFELREEGSFKTLRERALDSLRVFKVGNVVNFGGSRVKITKVMPNFDATTGVFPCGGWPSIEISGYHEVLPHSNDARVGKKRPKSGRRFLRKTGKKHNNNNRK